MTLRTSSEKNCSMLLLFPNFENETTLEISIDGGKTYPFSISDDLGTYEIRDLGAGTYTVFVRYPGSEAVPMGDVYLSSCNTTSIDNSIAGIEIKMYPNPTSSILFVDGLEGFSEIDIVDILGKTCKSVIVQGSSTSIDMADFPKALYFVKVKIGSESFMRKITKM